MGFSEPVRRSTLADANEARDWRIHAELAGRLIVQARKLYAGEDLVLELTTTVYALDSTTIDLCLFGGDRSRDRRRLRPDDRLGRPLRSEGLPRALRRIRYDDAETGKALVFLPTASNFPR